TRYLALTGDNRLPVLTLTPTGLTALKARVAIPLPVRVPAPPDLEVTRWMGQGARSVTVAETMALHHQGLTPSQIARERSLSVSTIYGHLARMIADGEIALESVVTADVIAQVRTVVEELGAETLSPVKQRLPDAISYGEIRCVIAGLGLTADLDRDRSEGGKKQPGWVTSDMKLTTEIAKSPPVDETLFETLRQWRTAQAREQKVPPYVVFNDRVLRAIASILPTDPEALRAIPGVGPA
ncbi:MAG: hypothetical protein GTO63_12440, partial [Anaerolineae bacterium]|nr:hypothetical protein [Anaerolineae bacterium]NIN95707.1 hypothetical protein [Anaerolineae bacterium]NIQ78641.1 hypothetical protein [Anaerolineae bacterium]